MIFSCDSSRENQIKASKCSRRVSAETWLVSHAIAAKNFEVSRKFLEQLVRNLSLSRKCREKLGSFLKVYRGTFEKLRFLTWFPWATCKCLESFSRNLWDNVVYTFSFCQPCKPLDKATLCSTALLKHTKQFPITLFRIITFQIASNRLQIASQVFCLCVLGWVGVQSLLRNLSGRT